MSPRTTRTTRTRTTIFKLIGPCETLSRSKTIWLKSNLNMLTFLEIFKMLNIPNKRPPSFVLYNHSVCVLYETNHFGAKCEANAKITLRSHQPQLVSRNFSFGEGRTFKNGMKMKLRRPPYPVSMYSLSTEPLEP